MLVALVAAGCSSETNASDPTGSSLVSSPPSPIGVDPAGATGTQWTVGGPQIHLTCEGTSPPGSPTVILVSDHHGSSEVWEQDDPLQVAPPAAGRS